LEFTTNGKGTSSTRALNSLKMNQRFSEMRQEITPSDAYGA
jgi:hypothetical protein